MSCPSNSPRTSNGSRLYLKPLALFDRPEVCVGAAEILACGHNDDLRSAAQRRTTTRATLHTGSPTATALRFTRLFQRLPAIVASRLFCARSAAAWHRERSPAGVRHTCQAATAAHTSTKPAARTPSSITSAPLVDATSESHLYPSTGNRQPTPVVLRALRRPPGLRACVRPYVLWGRVGFLLR